jgi:hypothetical protein
VGISNGEGDLIEKETEDGEGTYEYIQPIKPWFV